MAIDAKSGKINLAQHSTYQIIPIVKRQKLMWSFFELYSPIIRALLHLYKDIEHNAWNLLRRC